MCRLILIALIPLLLSAGAARANGAATDTLVSPEEGLRRIGTLPNGLSYVIERAGTATDKIEMYLVVRAGIADGVPGEPDAAHVLEHIVVKKLRDQASKGAYRERLARMGLRDGRDANASTGIDLTTYGLRLPANSPAALASGMDILSDWASPMEITDEDVDRERNASVEEGRQSYAATGQLESLLKHRVWYPGHPIYGAEYSVAGTARVSAATVRALHRRLYNPANMAVIIVGPVHVDAVQRDLIKRMAAIPSGTANRSGSLSVDSLVGGQFAAITHPDQRETKVGITFKNRRPHLGSPANVRDVAVRRVADILFRDAFRNLSSHYGAAIFSGGVSMSLEANLGQAARIDITSFDALVRVDGIKDALSDMLRLVAAVRRDGFAEKDIEQARYQVAASLDVGASSPTQIIEKWSTRFRFGELEPEPNEIREVLKTLSSAEINAAIAEILAPARRDIFVVYGPAGAAGVPQPTELPGIIASAERGARASLSAPPIEAPSFTPVRPVDVVAVKEIVEEGGFRRWTLPRSGATLLFKRTDSDRASLAMLRKGGTSRFAHDLRADALASRDIVQASGLGTLDRFDTSRFLNAKSLFVAPLIEPYREGVGASGPKQQWPMIVQLVRAQFVQPQCRKAAFEEAVAMQRDAAIQNPIGTVLRARLDALIAETFREPASWNAMTSRDLEEICGLYATMLSDTKDMTIVAQGDLDAEQVYRAIAEGLDIAAMYNEAAPPLARPVESAASRRIIRDGKDAALVELRIRMATSYPELAAVGSTMRAALDSRLIARLRDAEKGVYSVTVAFNADLDPDVTVLSIGFTCDPSNFERLIAAVKEELLKFREEGAGATELAAARQPLGLAEHRDAVGVAEAWITRRPPTPSADTKLAQWRRDFFDPARLAEFVLVSE